MKKGIEEIILFFWEIIDLSIPDYTAQFTEEIFNGKLHLLCRVT